MQLREKPQVVMDPEVMHMMKGDMIDIRDMVLNLAVKVAEKHGIPIVRIAIRQGYIIEDDWEDVILEVHVAVDEDSAFAYWEAVCDSISEVEQGMTKGSQDLLNERMAVFVEW